MLYILLLLLVTSVVFVNGWTDAPNAIACCVSTGALPYRKAVQMAAVCNFLGIFVMAMVSTAVADTVSGMVRLDSSRPELSIAALCAAMSSIVLFAVAAWYFGIPTSESHALIAGLTGAAIALDSINAVNMAAWSKVLWGLGMSLVIGFLMGYWVTLLLGRFLGGDRLSDRVQILSAGSMAFMHGAQSGQKFIAVFIMAGALTSGHSPGPGGNSLLLMLFVAVVMGLGTLTGGQRIITRVGKKMVTLEKYQGACADIGGALCLLLASLLGIPMSTTHTKTTAIMGAGRATGRGKVNWQSVRGMVTAWLITFPVCGLLGYLLTGWFASLA